MVLEIPSIAILGSAAKKKVFCGTWGRSGIYSHNTGKGDLGRFIFCLHYSILFLEFPISSYV